MYCWLVVAGARLVIMVHFCFSLKIPIQSLRRLVSFLLSPMFGFEYRQRYVGSAREGVTPISNSQSSRHFIEQDDTLIDKTPTTEVPEQL